MEDEPITLPTRRSVPFDPPLELGQLREGQPLSRLRYPDGHIGWLVTNHAYGRAVLADPRFSVRPLRLPVGDPAKIAAFVDTADTTLDGILIATDPPQHTRLRRSVAGRFTVRRVNERRSRIQELVAGCLDVMEQAGPPVDLVDMFALPVPSLAICELLGVPQSDRNQFEEPSAILLDPEASTEEMIAAQERFGDYARGVIQRKRRHPADDLLSDLIRDEHLNDEEIAGMAIQLFQAGHETTAAMLALGTFVLLGEPTRWQALTAEPSLVDGLVEELLRYLTIIQYLPASRTALEDVELAGMVIKAGESVTVSLPAANRDPKRFADPDALDLTRRASSHLAFGHGIHMCIGQHLARLELQVGLAGLSGRFPTLRLAVPPEEVPWTSDDRIPYGVRQLPVAW